MATVAVFLALGGTAFAVAANSIGSKQIKPGGVKTGDIANGAITSDLVRDGALNAGDFDQLNPPDPGSTETIITARRSTQNGYGVIAKCQDGEQLISGGGSASGMSIRESQPFNSFNIDVEDGDRDTRGWGWRIIGTTHPKPDSPFVEAIALCARFPGPGAGPMGPAGPRGQDGPAGILPDQVCQVEGQYVRGISGGEIVCSGGVQ